MVKTHLAMQGTLAPSWVWEDPTRCGTVCPCAPAPGPHSKRSLHSEETTRHSDEEHGSLRAPELGPGSEEPATTATEQPLLGSATRSTGRNSEH